MLVGDDTRQCHVSDGKQPYCAYKWFPVLQPIANVALNVAGYSENLESNRHSHCARCDGLSNKRWHQPWTLVAAYIWSGVANIGPGLKTKDVPPNQTARLGAQTTRYLSLRIVTKPIEHIKLPLACTVRAITALSNFFTKEDSIIWPLSVLRAKLTPVFSSKIWCKVIALIISLLTRTEEEKLHFLQLSLTMLWFWLNELT